MPMMFVGLFFTARVRQDVDLDCACMTYFLRHHMAVLFFFAVMLVCVFDRPMFLTPDPTRPDPTRVDLT